jgi:hypothetical protein
MNARTILPASNAPALEILSFDYDSAMQTIAMRLDDEAGDTESGILKGVQRLQAAGYEVEHVGEPDDAVEPEVEAGKWFAAPWLEARRGETVQLRRVSVVAQDQGYDRVCEVIATQRRVLDHGGRILRGRGAVTHLDKRWLNV